MIGDVPAQRAGTVITWRAAPRLDVIGDLAALRVDSDVAPDLTARARLRLDERGAGQLSGELRRSGIGADAWIEIAQVGLATFTSQEGLERVGDGLMSATAASGQALIDIAGTGARGSLVSGALEASNVDLGTELVTLIAYQRAFQANAKTVTTADEMMNDINNLKR